MAVRRSYIAGSSTGARRGEGVRLHSALDELRERYPLGLRSGPEGERRISGEEPQPMSPFPGSHQRADAESIRLRAPDLLLLVRKDTGRCIIAWEVKRNDAEAATR